jgi:hypothetical protein
MVSFYVDENSFLNNPLETILIRNFKIECNITCEKQSIKLNKLTKFIKFIDVVFYKLDEIQFQFENLELLYIENATISSDLVNTTFLNISNTKVFEAKYINY